VPGDDHRGRLGPLDDGGDDQGERLVLRAPNGASHGR
jgi:hypothetical protein